MKLKKLKIAGIRGFNDEQSLDFEGKLVIYSGPNGGGKTSVGEAIEWLFYGKTLKRIKGDEISKREYAGSYRNTHYHGAASPFVEAQILDTVGRLRTIRRDLDIDESSILSVDGKPCGDLQEFGIGALYDRPLILQHTLQDFIFMRPKTRYEVLSAMLGLEPLVEFRNAVEAARTDFQNGLPSRAVEARNRANLLLGSFRIYPLLQPVVTAVTQGKLKEARKHLIQIGLGRVAAGTRDTEIVPALQQTKAAKERAKLNWGRFSINPVAKPEGHSSITGLGALKTFVDRFALNVTEALTSVGASAREPIAQRVRSFYEQGLGLVDKGKPQTCPFCFEDTLTPARIAELRRTLEPLPEAKAPLLKAKQSIDSLLAAIPLHWQEVLKLIPQMPTIEEKITIIELTSESPTVRGAYFASCDALSSAVTELEESKSLVDSSVRSTDDALNAASTPPEERVPTLKSAIERYAEKVKGLISVANGYAANYSALDPGIKSKLASEQDVRFLSGLIQGLEQWSDLEVSRRVDQILDDLQQLIRENRKFIEIKQKQTLGVRDQEIKSWYQLLTGTAQVGYAGITPGTDNLELRARTFARGMMAAPNLSSSQLNCIGLAVYLATCCRKRSPFKLILFDDPIQSMDDEHTEAFKKQVIGKLLDRDFQVILLTHMDNFADAVELLYRSQGPLLYRMQAYTETGPNVIWKGPEINKLLNEAKRNKDSLNDGYRKEAVQALRQFVERLVKDIFTANTRNSIPGKYEDKTWTELRKLLRQCTRFDPQDEAQLEDTHNFTSPYLHTDEALAQKVPSPHQLNPHYESMKGLLEKYSSLLQLT